MALGVDDVAATTEFLVQLGMRRLQQGEDIGILELRGGTHLVVLPSREPVAPGTRAPFDLMVEDLEATRKQYAELGLGPSEIRSGDFHRSFTVVAPSGHEITVNSSHVVGPV